MVDDFVMPLPLPLDVVSLTMSLVNIESLTGAEGTLADAIEQALGTQPHLAVERFADTIVARTNLGFAERVLVVGHLDTVPEDGNLLAYVEMGKLFGLGACDMKGGLAVMLKSATLPAYGRDVTLLFYDGEEASEPSGIERLSEQRPDLLQADLAIVMEPTDARVEVTTDSPLVAALRRTTASSDVELVETPVARKTAAHLAALGIPALTFGPGDPVLAHTREEYVPTAQLTECEFWLRLLLKD